MAVTSACAVAVAGVENQVRHPTQIALLIAALIVAAFKINRPVKGPDIY